jgi:hypothetical protein
LLVLCTALAAPAQAQTVTELLRNGPNGEKFNLVIIGDGFTAGVDQTAFNTFVQNTVIRDLFDETRDGAYREIMGAFNIFRINANSAATGITTIDNNGNVTNAVNTFLGYLYSGMWGRCWMEPGPNTNTTLNTTLNRNPSRSSTSVSSAGSRRACSSGSTSTSPSVRAGGSTSRRA